MAVTKIISGAQTGADRAGLDAGIALGLSTDEGPLSMDDFKRYALKQHPSPNYPPRTEQNVIDSDGTVLFGNMNSPGCRLTIKYCKAHKKPFLCLATDQLAGFPAVCISALRAFVNEHNPSVLNIAGNRESTNPNIYAMTFATIMNAFGCQFCLLRIGRVVTTCEDCQGSGRQ